MLTRKIFWALGIILILGAGSGTALAQNPLKAEMLKNQLGLTEQQVDQLQVIGGKYRADILPLEQQLKVKNQALRAALDTAQPNAAIVGQIVIEQRVIRKQLNQRNGQLRRAIFAVLTPAQKQKLAGLGLGTFIKVANAGRKGSD